MKIKGKITLLNVLILVFVVFLVTLVGAFSIGSVVGKLNSKIVSYELNGAYNKILNAYNILVDTGMADFENYVEETQEELIKEFSEMEFGKTGNFFAVTFDKRVMYGKNYKKNENIDCDFVDEMLKNKKESGVESILSYNFKGKKRFAKYIAFDQWEWLIIISLEQGEMFEIRNRFLTIVTISSILVIIISLLINSLFTSRIIINPLKNLTLKIKDISEGEGDLTAKLNINSSDEIGEFAGYFNDFIDKLNGIIVEIKNTTFSSKDLSLRLGDTVTKNLSSINNITSVMDDTLEQIRFLNIEMQKSEVSVNEINNFINNVVSLIEEQSASVNQSSSSVEEIIASINNISIVAEDKKQLTNNLTSLAKNGETDMKKTVTSIEDIAKSATVIFDMIKVIKNVSEQTNLLAMNAAIEAAHAGEYGKGFAVVADEIRKLAETTGNNSKDISSSLKSILEKINSTSSMTKNTGITITDIIKGIIDISNSMNEMTNGMKELSIGSNQIITALNSLISITENVRNTSQEMNKRSDNIDKSVKNVVVLTQKNKDSIEKATSLINDIAKSFADINKLSVDNQKNINGIENEILKFKTK